MNIPKSECDDAEGQQLTISIKLVADNFEHVI